MAYEYDISLTKANKDVTQGIAFMKRLEGKIFVSDEVGEVFLRQWHNYCMKNDKVVKKNDHILDALRYALFTAYTFWPEYFEFLKEEWDEPINSD